MTMIIRKTVINGLAGLSILLDNYRRFYKKESDLTGAAGFLQDRMLHNDSEIFIAENEERLIMGFVQLYPIFSSTRMNRLGWLNDLFIQPEHRTSGISTTLIDECKNLCRRTNSCGMIVETAKDNTIGNNLYLKTGFLPDSHHNYYQWGIEAI